MKLEEIKKIADARTKGEWLVGGDYYNVIADLDGKNDVWPLFGISHSHPYYKANAKFIAMAANNIDKLIAIAEASQQLIDNIFVLRFTGDEQNLKEKLKALEERGE